MVGEENLGEEGAGESLPGALGADCRKVWGKGASMRLQRLRCEVAEGGREGIHLWRDAGVAQLRPRRSRGADHRGSTPQSLRHRNPVVLTIRWQDKARGRLEQSRLGFPLHKAQPLHTRKRNGSESILRARHEKTPPLKVCALPRLQEEVDALLRVEASKKEKGFSTRLLRGGVEELAIHAVGDDAYRRARLPQTGTKVFGFGVGSRVEPCGAFQNGASNQTQKEAFIDRDGLPSEGAECAVRRKGVGAREATGADSAQEYRKRPEAVQVQEGATPQKHGKAVDERERKEEGVAEDAVHGEDLDALGATLREQGVFGRVIQKDHADVLPGASLLQSHVRDDFGEPATMRPTPCREVQDVEGAC